MIAQHTALPWHGMRDGTFSPSEWSGVHETAGTFCSAPITNDDGVTVALVVCEGWDEGEMQANAEFIVHACNAHDDLVKALQRAKTWIVNEMHMKGYPEERTENPPAGSHLHTINEALAKAGAA